jgi:hypothetical protein
VASPGIVLIVPISGYTNPAPTLARTSRTVSLKPLGTPLRLLVCLWCEVIVRQRLVSRNGVFTLVCARMHVCLDTIFDTSMHLCVRETYFHVNWHSPDAHTHTHTHTHKTWIQTDAYTRRQTDRKSTPYIRRQARMCLCNAHMQLPISQNNNIHTQHKHKHTKSQTQTQTQTQTHFIDSQADRPS